MITTLNLTPQLQFRTLLFSFSFTLDMIRLLLSIQPSRVGVTTQESLANFVAISLQHSLSQFGLDPTLLFHAAWHHCKTRSGHARVAAIDATRLRRNRGLHPARVQARFQFGSFGR